MNADRQAQPGRKRARYQHGAWLLATCLLCAGCSGPGFAAYVVGGPPKVKARHTLDKRPTLVIVDDPKDLLGDANFPAVIGANAGFHLIENAALPRELVVPQDHLSTLAAQLGDRYLATPIDRIGQRLDAEQVVHVLVRATNLRVDNTYYHPTATVEVKVIEAATGARLFPGPGDAAHATATAPGYSLNVELKRQTIDENRRHALSMLARSLSERIGLEVAQVFYDHVPPDAEPKVRAP